MARILVAEDDDDIRFLITLRLETSGHSVLAVGDGLAALEVCYREPVDLVLLDWMMPRMHGPEVCRALRSNVHLLGLPIVLLTARSEASDFQQGLAAGADDYILKPFDPRELVMRLEALLSPSVRSVG